MYLTVVLLVFLCLKSGSSFAKPKPIGLRASSTLRNLLFGTAINVDNLRTRIDGGNYNSNVTNNYHLIVPESELKAKRIWMGENLYNWNDSDWLLGSTLNSTGWVQENQMQLRGHNLVWPKDTRIPQWLLDEESSITSDKARLLLSDYISNVVSRYRGKIPWWDVVNEAIDDSENNTHPFNLRDSFWFRKLGPDFLKYAFISARQADPDVKLYYNDYNNHYLGLKANRTIELVNWLRSEGAIVDGIGLQWHINISVNITPGDAYYQAAQEYINHGYDFMVTELDISVPTIGGYPNSFVDLEKQGLIYRSILDYVLSFSPHCRAMLTWGFTDRYSYVPERTSFTEGSALPLDWLYFPKPAYHQMQEDLARIIPDGIYGLSPSTEPEKCLSFVNNTVQLLDGLCHSTSEQWNLTWLDDGTYRFSPVSSPHHALEVLNATAPIGEIQISSWTGEVSQEWAFSAKENQTYEIVPRTAWWRSMIAYNSTEIVIDDHRSGQNWILKSLFDN